MITGSIMHRKWCLLLLPTIAEKPIPSAHLFMGLKGQLSEEAFRACLHTMKTVGLVEEKEETLRILPLGQTYADKVGKLIYQAVVC